MLTRGYDNKEAQYVVRTKYWKGTKQSQHETLPTKGQQR